eukprot:15255230-Alexandrium_andersonii.AAC.1
MSAARPSWQIVSIGYWSCRDVGWTSSDFAVLSPLRCCSVPSLASVLALLPHTLKAAGLRPA